MEVRQLTDRDAERYRQLRLEALEREPHAFTESADEHQSLTLESIRSHLAPDENQFVVGAIVDQKLVGMAGFFRRRGEKIRHRGGIWGVYVSEEFRGKDIGRALLKEVIRLARALPGIEQVTLAVSSGNARAKGLYESLGFEVYGCEKAALKIGDIYVDEELMVLYFQR